MPYNDLQELCKSCEYMKVWSPDMGGNHGCCCMEHQIKFFYKKDLSTCDKYLKIELTDK